MTKSTRVAIIFGVLIVLALGVWYVSSLSSTSNFSASSAPATSVEATSSSQSSNGVAPMSAAVTYTAGGFSPSTVTIKQGGTITFTSVDGSKMWVASNPHPSHTGYSGTTKQQHCPDVQGIAFDQCSIGPVYSFTFQKIGTWGYHNHTSTSDGGTVIVVQ